MDWQRAKKISGPECLLLMLKPRKKAAPLFLDQARRIINANASKKITIALMSDMPWGLT